MQNLYAPWRGKYLKDYTYTPSNCVFCEVVNSNEDEKNFVFYRDDMAIGMLNLYPYSAYHMLFLPLLHVGDPSLLTQEIWTHLNLLGLRATNMLLAEFKSQGVNYGYNIGEASGAGIGDHLHLHILPRYRNDTNFLTSIAETRVFGFDIEKTFLDILRVKDKYFKEIR